MENTKTKFSMSRVIKLMKLDLYSNKKQIKLALLGSVVISVCYLWFFYTSSMGELKEEAGYGFSVIMLFPVIFVINSIMYILWAVNVFRRANGNKTLHISQIPATAKEKYLSFFFEWIIITLFIILLFSILYCTQGIIIFKNYTVFSDIATFFSAINKILWMTNDNNVVVWMNIIGFTWIFIMQLLHGFTFTSAACLAFNKAKHSILFIVFVPQMLGMFISIFLTATTYFFFNAQYDGEKVLYLALNIAFWGAIILSTLYNIGLIIWGYYSIARKQNKN